LLLVPYWRAERGMRRGVFLFLVSAFIYGLEFAIGVHLWLAPKDTGAFTSVPELILGAYAIGLGRAWGLLGARRLGWTGLIAAGWHRLRQRTPAPKV
jgi:hypothetical protein